MTDRLERLYANITRFIEQGGFKGAAVAAAVGGAQVVEWYSGEAAPGLPAGPDVIWPLASISKSYTAAMVMALVERGALTLSLRASEVLDGFTGAEREQITLRHLLTHTSGLIYESPEMETRLVQQVPIKELLDEAYTHPLLFAPGTGFSYSDYGYALAGRMAEAVTGHSFPDLVRTLVLEPAGLTQTFMPPPPAAFGRMAHVVESLAYGTAGAMYNSPHAIALAHPSFGTVASANDLLRFGLLFAPGSGRRLHAEATVRTMSTDQTGGHAPGMSPGAGSTGTPVAWGFGFSVQTPHAIGPYADLTPPGTFGHGGASGCTLVINPIDRITIAVVSNAHARTGRERWSQRLGTIVNGVMAALTW